MTTPTSPDYQAAQRTKARDRGQVYLGPGSDPVPFDRVLDHVAETRIRLAELEREAVLVGRRQGCSWDRLAYFLRGTVTGRGLRNRYAGDPQVTRGGGH